MNKITLLALALTFVGTAHAHTSAHPKAPVGTFSAASMAARNALGNASMAAGTSIIGNVPRNDAPKCIQMDAPKNGAIGAPCHPARAAQL